jgi:hypothetical protein
MALPTEPPRRTQRVVIPLTVVVGVITTAVAYFGTREEPSPRPLPAPAAAKVPVEMVVLPHDEAELPPGPHQRTFAVACTVCHSTRLVMTQPSFPREKWEEVVHKMVKTFGAAITPEEQAQVIDYLVAVRGK